MKRLVIALSVFFCAFLGSPTALALESSAVDVWSENGELSAGDADFLREHTAQLELPSVITEVDYIVLSKGSENLNVDMVEFARSQRPELVAQDDKKWAPGHLIVAVSMDARKNGIYMGDDVAATTEFDEKRKEYALDAMKPDLKNGNVALGMFNGAKAATVDEVPENHDGLVAGAVASLSVLGGLFVGFVALRSKRRSDAERARKEFDFVSQNYGRVAQDLDAINVRAHSLTSPLANDALREQWEDVRDRFLQLNEIQAGIPDLTGASDATVRRHAKDIAFMHETVTHMQTAENNINDLYDMEHGGTDVRRRELHKLRADMLEARLKTDRYDTEMTDLMARADTLIDQQNDANFMDSYAVLLSDYRVVSKAIAQEKKLEVPKQQTPKLYENNWQVGTGYNSWVPFIVINEQHKAYEAQRAEQSSSSVNSSYGSTGFSGAGGSSSW